MRRFRVRPRFLLLLLVASSQLSAQATAKKPMSIADLLTAIRVGDPQLSPDGKRVLYTRTTTDLAVGARNTDIWSVAADGASPPAPFVVGPKSENSPRFFPDGKRVAFISSRNGAPQIFIADAAGKLPKVLTKISGGVQGPMVISPDGKSIAFVSDVYPDCKDEACNKMKRDAAEKDPVKVHALSQLPFRHWDEWWETVHHHVFIVDVATGATRDATPGLREFPPHNYEDAAIAFSPDSKQMAVVAKDYGSEQMWSTNSDVYFFNFPVGDHVLGSMNQAADYEPKYSPDGRFLATRSQLRSGFESDRWYINVYDRSKTGGAHRAVFDTPDISVDAFQYSLDSKDIWFTAAEKGTTNLYTVPAAGGKPRRVALGGVIGDLHRGANFSIVSKSTLTSPAEVFRINDDGTSKQLTHENDSWLAARDLQKPEAGYVSGAGGAQVHYWLIKPPGFNPKGQYPAVFLIHGGPQGDWNDGWSSRWNPTLWAAQGWVVIAPNPRGSFGFGQKFVDEISQDWCGKVMTDLEAVFKMGEKLPYVNPARLGVAGASYGGYAVDWLIGHTNRFRAAVSHDGVFNLESMAYATEELWFTEWEFGGKPWSPAAKKNFAACSPHLSVDQMRTPTFVITNEQDFRVPLDQGLQLFTALKRQSVATAGLTFPDEGHWVLKPLNSKRWHEEVFKWMGKYLNSNGRIRE